MCSGQLLNIKPSRSVFDSIPEGNSGIITVNEKYFWDICRGEVPSLLTSMQSEIFESDFVCIYPDTFPERFFHGINNRCYFTRRKSKSFFKIIRKTRHGEIVAIFYFLHSYCLIYNTFMFSIFKKSPEATPQETKLIILVALYIFCVIMTETLGIKTTPVGNIALHFGPLHIPQLKVSMAIFFIPFIYCINDILAQVWGYKTARAVYRISLISIVALAFFSWLATTLPPSMIFVNSEGAFDTIFGQTLRFSLASITAFAVSDILDVIIFCRLRERLRDKSLWLSTNLSNFIAQGIDGALFVYLAMYTPGTESFWAGNHAFMWGVILPYWVFRCCMSIFATPFVYAGVKWGKK